MLDNLVSHKGRAARTAIEAAAAEFRFLPPYSPDLDPIEQVFATLKTMLRKQAPAHPARNMATHRIAGDEAAAQVDAAGDEANRRFCFSAS